MTGVEIPTERALLVAAVVDAARAVDVVEQYGMREALATLHEAIAALDGVEPYGSMMLDLVMDNRTGCPAFVAWRGARHWSDPDAELIYPIVATPIVYGPDLCCCERLLSASARCGECALPYRQGRMTRHHAACEYPGYGDDEVDLDRLPPSRAEEAKV